MKKRFVLIILFSSLFAELFAIKPLIVYRPENDHPMNEIRCYIQITDDKGDDVTYSCGNAFYSWANIPGRYFAYKKKYFLTGGMAFHINILPGKYKITVFTPKDEHYQIECENNGQWDSNYFEYDSENPINVIFVSPEVNYNQFYNGKWHINYRAPKFFKFTTPYLAPETKPGTEALPPEKPEEKEDK